ncbi:MAG: Ribosomal RNA large subunit methyltransferase H [Alphaproteobacteria bacterium MarineAlpha11_Bin1]|nr:MAG: Ribosomal RNA large subunit methyltransferase H [Alphaproteobacteria bacterium MarineAlpha11_Bin1]|tara:strand:- start:15128 stop:15583 length:456 start_codon:yes stop_codon:yes gene_type:complete
MKITLCAVGRIKAGPERELMEKYRRRIMWQLDIVEVEERRNLSAGELKRREGNLIEHALPHGDIRVAMDERGQSLSSRDFATKLSKWQDQGKNVAFIIGGAAGLDGSLRNSSDTSISFGAATWPYKLARVMLVEQLYRAQEIIAGRAYHRG